MYKFVRIGSVKSDEVDSQYCLVPRSVDDVIEHYQKIVMPIMRTGIQWKLDNVTGRNKMCHPIDQWGSVIEKVDSVICNTAGGSLWLKLDELEKQDFNNRIDTFNKYGGKMLLTDSMVIRFMIPNLFEVKDIQYRKDLIYPDIMNPSKSDIRIISWSGGTHFYAKIGNVDVVDDDGNQKWNTLYEAEKAAYKYLKDNYK